MRALPPIAWPPELAGAAATSAACQPLAAGGASRRLRRLALAFGLVLAGSVAGLTTASTLLPDLTLAQLLGTVMLPLGLMLGLELWHAAARRAASLGLPSPVDQRRFSRICAAGGLAAGLVADLAAPSAGPLLATPVFGLLGLAYGLGLDWLVSRRILRLARGGR